MKLIGHCRFSFLGPTDTGKEVRTVEAAQEKLWNAERMAVRFHLFETLTLPSIRAQTDTDFKLFVLTSEAMPDIYKDRLSKITADISQIEVIFAKTDDTGRELRHVNYWATDEGTSRHTQFRIDDDDALGKNYIAKLRYMADFAPDNAILSMPRGLVAFVDSNGQIGRFAPFFMPYIGQGIARVERAGKLRHPFQMRHRQEYQSGISVVDGVYPAYIYALHSANNTSGYEKRRYIYSTEDERYVVKATKKNHPELSDEICTQEARETLAAEFSYLTPEQLSKALTDTVDIRFENLPPV